jgi:preprotein translocase subunit YajC
LQPAARDQRLFFALIFTGGDMFDIAFAQTVPGAGGPSQLISFLPLVLVFVIFYFLLIRPQQKKTRDHQQMLSKLKKNDEVMTSGGIYGKVTALTDNVVTVEVAPNVRIRVNRPQISTVITGEKNPTKEARD